MKKPKGPGALIGVTDGVVEVARIYFEPNGSLSAVVLTECPGSDRLGNALIETVLSVVFGGEKAFTEYWRITQTTGIIE